MRKESKRTRKNMTPSFSHERGWLKQSDRSPGSGFVTYSPRLPVCSLLVNWLLVIGLMADQPINE
jgi:hypothetical protein